MTRIGSVVALSLVVASLAGTPVTAMAQEKPHAKEQTTEARLLAAKSPAFVTIKFILKGEEGGPMSMFGGGGDQEMEVTGVMIDPKGLVLASSTEMGGWMSRFARMGMGGGAQSTPTEIKILVGDDTQGVDATLIARDSELDLTWLRMDKEPSAPYAFVDFAKASTPQVGEHVYAITRLGKFFDRAPVISEAKIAGTTKKPRDLLLGGAGAISGMGLPVFDKDGNVAGVSSLITPEAEEMEAMSGGMFGGMGDMMAGAIIPAKDVAEATKRALENAGKEGATEEPASTTTDPDKKE